MLHLYYELLTQWLYLHPEWGIIIAFFISFSESIAIIGSLVPGSITMTAVGILVGSGVLPLWETLVFAVSGAVFGDGLSYFLGYRFKENVKDIWPFRKYPGTLIKGQSFVLKHGGKSVFIGRFIGPVRAIVPIIAGMFDMKPKKYFFASIPAAILWAPIYMMPGILLGAISLEMPKETATWLIISVLLILLAIWMIIKIIIYLYQKTHLYLAEVFDKKWLVWEKHPQKQWICYFLRYAERPNARGQILLAILCSIALFLFLLIFIDARYIDLLSWLNDLIYHSFRSIRAINLDKFMVIITSFGYGNMIAPVLFVTAVFFAIRKNYLAAIHCFLVYILIFCSVGFFKHFFFFARPEGIVNVSNTSSFPSGHTSYAIAILGILAFFISRTIKTNIRRYVYYGAISLCVLVGISRLYLSAHWLQDVLGGTFLGLFCLGVTIISYRRYHPKEIKKDVLYVIGVSFILSMSWHLYQNYSIDLHNHQLEWHSHIISYDSWLNQSSPVIPVYRINRLGSKPELLNIQWVGSLKDITETLKQQGWKEIRNDNYLITLEEIVEQNVKRYKTLLPTLYDDQYPVLEMVKFVDPEKPPLILRLWKSNIYIALDHKPLWVGTIYYDQLQRRLLFKRHINYQLSENFSGGLNLAYKENGWYVKIVNKRLDKVILISNSHYADKYFYAE